MGDYFQHWLNMGEKVAAKGGRLPAIFTTNWFRKGADGKFVWPGYGENMRVLKWMIDRIEDEAKGKEHFYGLSPSYEEFNWNGLDFTPEQFHSVTSIDKAQWLEELKLHDVLFQQIDARLPKALRDTRARIEKLLTSA